MGEKKIPRHVAIIMDGNGRWAEKCGKTRVFGHIEGAKRVPVVANALFNAGVETVSLYAFSEENFARPAEEVTGIFDRIAEFLTAFPSYFLKGSVRLIFSGDLTRVGDGLRRACDEAEASTRLNAPYTLNILLNYGGRTEILRAARLLCGQNGDEQDFRRGLYNGYLHDPDLIIRTGGEKRLSGFMPFQSAYSELYFTDVLFPDINEDDIALALEDFAGRDRRFGGLK